MTFFDRPWPSGLWSPRSDGDCESVGSVKTSITTASCPSGQVWNPLVLIKGSVITQEGGDQEGHRGQRAYEGMKTMEPYFHQVDPYFIIYLSTGYSNEQSG